MCLKKNNWKERGILTTTIISLLVIENRWHKYSLLKYDIIKEIIIIYGFFNILELANSPFFI